MKNHNPAFGVKRVWMALREERGWDVSQQVLSMCILQNSCELMLCRYNVHSAEFLRADAIIMCVSAPVSVGMCRHVPLPSSLLVFSRP